MTFEHLALAFRAYVEHICERPVDVEEALKRYELPPGVAEDARVVLEAMPRPEDRGV